MLSPLAQRVLAYIRKRELMRAGERVAIGVSGGADSVALLRIMLELRAELGVVLSVAHFNHKIRGAASDEDEQFVRELAREHELQFWFADADVPAYARENSMSLETAARHKRYAFFENIMFGGTVERVATAHTLDDQAETVLMRLIRGTGVTGLAAIHPSVRVEDQNSAESYEIVRPLLDIRRADVEEYLRSVQQPWREDASNADLHHTRNRIRQLVVPLLERELNPAVRERLAELADIARAEDEFWTGHVEKVSLGILRHEVLDRGVITARFQVDALLHYPLALQRRVVRRACEPLGISLAFSKANELLELTRSACGSKIDLGNGVMARRERDDVIIAPAPDPERSAAGTYEYPIDFSAGWELYVRELGRRFTMKPSTAAATDRVNASKLTAFALMLRPWRPGDRFWPQHSSGPKKVKELLTDKHISGAERELWPVIACGDDIVWLRGFGVSQAYVADESTPEAIVITEQPLMGER